MDRGTDGVQAGAGQCTCLAMLCAWPAQCVLASHQTPFLAIFLSEHLSVLCTEVCVRVSGTASGAGTRIRRGPYVNGASNWCEHGCDC